MKILEQKINQRFDEERIKREDEESRIYNIINHRFTMLFNEINNEARNRLDSVGLQFGSQLSSGFNDSPHNYVNQGTSSYHPAYFNPDDANDDDNDDEFSI